MCLQAVCVVGEEGAGEGAHHIDNSSPCPENTQFSFSPYVSCAFLVAVTSLELRVSVCELVNLCMGPLKGPGFQAELCLTRQGQNPHWFSQPTVLGTPLPGTGALGWGVHCGAMTHRSSGGISTVDISLQILNCHMLVWEWLFMLLCPSHQSPCGFFLLLSYRSSFQLVLKWFPRFIVL